MDLIEFETTAGTFTVELYRLHAPKTCYNFTELVKIGDCRAFRLYCTVSSIYSVLTVFLCSISTGYYNDTIFHRVIRDFVSVFFVSYVVAL